MRHHFSNGVAVLDARRGRIGVVLCPGVHRHVQFRAAGQALPQTFPARQITVLSYTSPGPSSNALKVVTDRLAERWSSPSCSISGRARTWSAVAALLRAPADGHTVISITSAGDRHFLPRQNPVRAYRLRADHKAGRVCIGPVRRPQPPDKDFSRARCLSKTRQGGVSWGLLARATKSLWPDSGKNPAWPSTQSLTRARPTGWSLRPATIWTS